jgi:hypothetical protein
MQAVGMVDDHLVGCHAIRRRTHHHRAREGRANRKRSQRP